MSQAAAKVVETDLQAKDDAPTSTADAASDKGEVLTVQRADADLPLPMLMRKVAADYGKSFNQMLGEFVKLGYGPGKLTIEEYFTLRVFDDAALAGADKRDFVGLTAMRAIWEQLNYNQAWFGVILDKLASTALLGAYGFPVIPIEAIYSTSLDLPKPPCKVLRGADDLRAFLCDPANYPLFGKPTDSRQSLGSVSIDAFDAETGALTMVDGSKVALETMIADVTTHYASGYILQKRVLPHATIRAMCGPRLATVRIMTVNSKAGPEIIRAAWKIPAGANAADNFWRPGNMLGTIDIESGRITRVVRGSGIAQEQVEVHSDSGMRMIDFELPMWAEAKDLTLRAMKTFSSMGIIGWDVALTDAGPVIVEPNESPDYILPQLADRRGILDARMRALIAERKAEFAAIGKAAAKNLREEGRKRMASVSSSLGKV